MTQIGSVTSNTSEVIERVREASVTLRDRKFQSERNRRVAETSIELLRGTDLFHLLQPTRHGGLEQVPKTLVEAAIILGSACGSTAWCASLAVIHNWLIGLFPDQAQSDVWSNSDSIVAASYQPIGQCEPCEGGYRLSGAWPFASNCDNSEWFVVGAMVPAASEGHPPTQSWFLVPRSDASVEDTWFSAGMAGTGSKTIKVDPAVFVPSHRVLSVAEINSGDAPGAQVEGNPLYRLPFTLLGPFALAAPIVGIAKGAVRDFIEIARVKKSAQQGGPPVPMAQLPQVQFALAEASASADAAELLLKHAIEQVDALLIDGELPSVDLRIRIRRDQAFATRLSSQAVNLLFDVMGANGGALDSPIQLAWRDVNVAARHISLAWPSVGSMFSQKQMGLPPMGVY